VDKKRLEYLRKFFIAGGEPPQQGYWRDAADLQAYDDSFGQRIHWKWLSVFSELEKRGWQSSIPLKSLHDWGCGSGIAGRSFLASKWGANIETVKLSDYSNMASKFAAQKLNSAAIPPKSIEIITPGLNPPVDLLLVSHVANELSEQNRKAFLRSLKSAKHIIWVDAGTTRAAQTILWAREILLNSGYEVLAPCVKQSSCPIAASKKDWCHQHATIPGFVHTDPFWGKFQKELNIKISSLPLSFIVMAKSAAATLAKAPLAVSLGASKKNKAGLHALVCDGDAVNKKIVPLQRGDWSLF
jgi:hypothetical protein